MLGAMDTCVLGMSQLQVGGTSKKLAELTLYEHHVGHQRVPNTNDPAETSSKTKAARSLASSFQAATKATSAAITEYQNAPPPSHPPPPTPKQVHHKGGKQHNENKSTPANMEASWCLLAKPVPWLAAPGPGRES